MSFTAAALLAVPSYGSLFDESSLIQARIKGIALGDEVRVKLEIQRAEGVFDEIFLTLCEGASGGESEKATLETLKGALRTGRPLNVDYKPLFNRCIKSVSPVDVVEVTKSNSNSI